MSNDASDVKNPFHKNSKTKTRTYKTQNSTDSTSSSKSSKSIKGGKTKKSKTLKLDSLEKKHCTALFKSFANKKGYINEENLIHLIEESMESCSVTVPRKEIQEMAQTLMVYAAKKSTLSSKGMNEKQFQGIYVRYFLGNISGSDTHVRSSMKAMVRQHADIQIVTDHNTKSAPDMEEPSLGSLITIWFSDNLTRLVWMTIYLLVNVGSFMWKYDAYCNHNPEALAVSGTYVCYARGAAQVCLLNAGLILLPLCQSLLQWARETPSVRSKVPVDDSILMHKIIGYTLIGSGLVHTVAQLLGFVIVSVNASDNVWNASGLAASGAFSGPQPGMQEMFMTTPGWTGMILLVISGVATPFTFPKLRQNKFNLFWYSHFLFYPFFMAMLFIHGVESWLEPTQAYLFITFPVLLFCADRWNRMKLHGQIANIDILSIGVDPNAVQLCMEKPKNMDTFIPGSYVYLNFPELSQFEWHPFSLTSAPDDDFLSVHIRVAGDWTGALHKLCIAYKSSPTSTLRVKVDGPFGAPTVDYLNYEVVMVIGSGIGITPFASILRDLTYRLRENQCSHCKAARYDTFVPWNGTRSVIKKLYFHWCTPTQQSLRWFASSMNEISKYDKDENIEIHNHLTSIKAHTKSAMYAKTAQTLYHQMTGKDIISGLHTRSRTHFGRPDWHEMFIALAEKHKNEEIGVFYCGGRALQNEIKEMCARYSVGDCRFFFHCENF